MFCWSYIVFSFIVCAAACGFFTPRVMFGLIHGFVDARSIVVKLEIASFFLSFFVSAWCVSFFQSLFNTEFLVRSILVGAFVGCAVAFGCFSMAAMLAKRREYLYLGGLLSSGLSILFWLHFASSLFGGSATLFKFEVYLLFLLANMFPLLWQSQIFQNRLWHWHCNCFALWFIYLFVYDLDYVKHAITLFTDFAAVFVRILIIMVSQA